MITLALFLCERCFFCEVIFGEAYYREKFLVNWKQLSAFVSRGTTSPTSFTIMRSEHQEAVENYSDVKKQNRPYILGRGLQLNDFVFKIGETYFLGEDFLSQFSVVVMNMLYHLLRYLFKVFRYLGSNTKKRRKKILGRCAGLKKRENDYEHFLFFPRYWSVSSGRIDIFVIDVRRYDRIHLLLYSFVLFKTTFQDGGYFKNCVRLAR